jgi:hypothetical protein
VVQAKAGFDAMVFAKYHVTFCLLHEVVLSRVTRQYALQPERRVAAVEPTFCEAYVTLELQFSHQEKLQASSAPFSLKAALVFLLTFVAHFGLNPRFAT